MTPRAGIGPSPSRAARTLCAIPPDHASPRRRPRRKLSVVEDDFTSGPWTGYYAYPDGHRDRMELALSFRDRRLSGSGMDPIGAFVLEGAYDRETKTVWWLKIYPGSHEVYYKGARDGRGIRGQWRIPPFFGGNFRIWPCGQGEGEVDAAATEVGLEVEAETDALVPTEA